MHAAYSAALKHGTYHLNGHWQQLREDSHRVGNVHDLHPGKVVQVPFRVTSRRLCSAGRAYQCTVTFIAEQGQALTLSYLMILVMKFLGYTRSATMGILTRRTSTLGYSLSKFSTMACKKHVMLPQHQQIDDCRSVVRRPTLNNAATSGRQATVMLCHAKIAKDLQIPSKPDTQQVWMLGPRKGGCMSYVRAPRLRRLGLTLRQQEQTCLTRFCWQDCLTDRTQIVI